MLNSPKGGQTNMAEKTQKQLKEMLAANYENFDNKADSSINEFQKEVFGQEDAYWPYQLKGEIR